MGETLSFFNCWLDYHQQMPDNCCVPLCSKSGYRADADGRKDFSQSACQEFKSLKSKYIENK